jgi:NitT/TauT family transport system permease protein/sulfonate transport system permease protein
MKSGRSPVIVPALSISTFLLIWHLAGVFGVLTESSTIPRVSSVLLAAKALIKNGFLQRDLVASLWRVIPGIFIGSFLGAFVGLATGRMPGLYQTIGPFLHIWRALPAIAVVPFLLLVMGLTEVAKISLVSLGVFFPVWINTHEGVGHVERKYLEVAEDLDFTPFQVYARVILPSTIPFTVAGVRTGIAMAYIMVFIGEWIGANKGIGYQLSVAYTVGSTDYMVVGLIALGVLLYLTDAIYRTLVRVIFPWIDR